MHLSEAMKLGAMLKPQGFGAMIGGGVTCGLGAAIEAAGLQIYLSREGDISPLPTRPQPAGATVSYSIYIPDEWAALLARFDACPVCLGLYLVSQLIPHLNDDHRWTREQIATEFVEPIERAMGLWKPELAGSPSGFPVLLDDCRAEVLNCGAD